MATKKTTTPKAAPKPAPQPKPKDDRILVVIPWLRGPMQGRELEYAVAGWEMHFKERHTIVVTGADDPRMDGVVWVNSPRVAPKEGQYRQHLDYVSCFRKVRAAYPDSRGFIFVADDCYAINNFDIIDVMQILSNGETINCNANDPNAWKRDKAKGAAVLEAEGYATRNYTTHLPQWYDWDKLAALWDKYDMDNESYLMEDLYFNIYYSRHRPESVTDINADRIKCGVHRRDLDNARGGNTKTGLQYLKEAEEGGKIWITNSPDGWSDHLDNFLAKHYGI